MAAVVLCLCLEFRRVMSRSWAVTPYCRARGPPALCAGLPPMLHHACELGFGGRAVKYGVTSNYVLALEAVLPDGTVVRTGHRSWKGVAGYDLTHLLVGSEGTLAVITEATLKLIPPPRRVGTPPAVFPGEDAAAG